MDSEKRDAEPKQTTVEEGTQFIGTLNSSCHVIVRGQIDGDLNAPSLMISETGTVMGNVKAQSIQAAGVLGGRVDAEDIFLSGSVRSHTVIRARNLEVKLTGNQKRLEVTFGECILDVGDEPNSEPVQAPPPSKKQRRGEAAPVVVESGEVKNGEEAVSH
jgi:cytoskeletal protein CcmA (bactofilin family)